MTSPFDQRIVEPWHDPEVSIQALRVQELAGGSSVLINYFFSLSQEADLRRPRSGAWGKKTRENRIAGGWVAEVVDLRDGGFTEIGLGMHVIGLCELGAQVYLWSESDVAGERTLTRYDLVERSVGIPVAGHSIPEDTAFIPLEELRYVDRKRYYPMVEARIRDSYLREPDEHNLYPVTDPGLVGTR